MTVMILEIRTYRLKPGTRTEFINLMRAEAVPLLKRFGITVVDYGASQVDEDGHEEAYLMRAFVSLNERDKLELEFYGSQEWKDGPQQGIMSKIDNYHTVVIETSDEAVQQLHNAV
jgi:hypothetical protein